jgi:molybdopterin adenylyltransferase
MAKIRVAVLTCSDRCAAGVAEDASGPALVAAASAAGWTVTAQAILPDEMAAIAAQLRLWADNGAVDLVLTTGGTGLAARDVTPEATMSVLDREVSTLILPALLGRGGKSLFSSRLLDWSTKCWLDHWP